MDINICTFTGKLGKDPETRYAASGMAVCSFSVACNQNYKGEKKTEWINCVSFGKLAEICGEYLSKGRQVAISGRMQTDKWQDRDGNDRYTTKIILDKMTMFGSGAFKDEGPPAPTRPEDDDESIPF